MFEFYIEKEDLKTLKGLNKNLKPEDVDDRMFKLVKSFDSFNDFATIFSCSGHIKKPIEVSFYSTQKGVIVLEHIFDTVVRKTPNLIIPKCYISYSYKFLDPTLTDITLNLKHVLLVTLHFAPITIMVKEAMKEKDAATLLENVIDDITSVTDKFISTNITRKITTGLTNYMSEMDFKQLKQSYENAPPAADHGEMSGLVESFSKFNGCLAVNSSSGNGKRNIVITCRYSPKGKKLLESVFTDIVGRCDLLHPFSCSLNMHYGRAPDTTEYAALSFLPKWMSQSINDEERSILLKETIDDIKNIVDEFEY